MLIKKFFVKSFILIAFLLLSTRSISAADLILTNQTVSLYGTQNYDNVTLINSTINITPYDPSVSGTGTLIFNLTNNLNIDSTSSINGNLRGYPGGTSSVGGPNGGHAGDGPGAGGAGTGGGVGIGAGGAGGAGYANSGIAGNNGQNGGCCGHPTWGIGGPGGSGYGTVNGWDIDMGSGAGGGGGGSGVGGGGAGEAGGAKIIINAKNINVSPSGSITTIGGSGGSAGGGISYSGGSGNGASGGGILLNAINVNLNNAIISTSGGSGGSGGRFKVFYGTYTNTGATIISGSIYSEALPIPSCDSFTATPSNIAVGGSSVLSWSTTNITLPGDSITISDGAGYNFTATSTPGNTTVNPIAVSTYTLTATNSTSSDTCTATVSINAPTCTLSSSESAVLPNDTVILSWTAADAVSGTINGVNAVPIASGSMTSSPIVAPTAFTMSVTGPGGSGTCGPINVDLILSPIGGLVPCGRLGDNPNTTYDETEPCTLCHIFIMLQMISTFVVEIGGIVAIFFLVIGGLIYSTSAGNQGRMETGKKTMMWALFGLAIILLSWLIVTVVLTAFGYINPLGGQWNIVNCTVP